MVLGLVVDNPQGLGGFEVVGLRWVLVPGALINLWLLV